MKKIKLKKITILTFFLLKIQNGFKKFSTGKIDKKKVISLKKNITRKILMVIIRFKNLIKSLKLKWRKVDYKN